MPPRLSRHANTALADVTKTREPVHNDSMESYWMARNLKYLYLIFSSPDVLSSNEYVFNSGGHPLKIPEHTVKGLNSEVQFHVFDVMLKLNLQ